MLRIQSKTKRMISFRNAFILIQKGFRLRSRTFFSKFADSPKQIFYLIKIPLDPRKSGVQDRSWLPTVLKGINLNREPCCKPYSHSLVHCYYKNLEVQEAFDRINTIEKCLVDWLFMTSRVLKIRPTCKMWFGIWELNN